MAIRQSLSLVPGYVARAASWITLQHTVSKNLFFPCSLLDRFSPLDPFSTLLPDRLKCRASSSLITVFNMICIDWRAFVPPVNSSLLPNDVLTVSIFSFSSISRNSFMFRHGMSNGMEDSIWLGSLWWISSIILLC
uniref:Uncharacterized protein n=1 Tax=Cacopsylla melanoneura TaxID=428564 RepID=A0A8D9DNR9_9HEMI